MRPAVVIPLWLLALFAIAAPGASEHGSPYVISVKNEKEIAPNDGVLLQSQNGVEWTVGHLVQQTRGARAYFKNKKGHRVPARISVTFDDMEGCFESDETSFCRMPFEPDSGYGESLVLLMPQQKLHPLETYELFIRYPTGINLRFFREWSPGKWHVAAMKDLSAPTWNDAPYVKFEKVGTYEDADLSDTPRLVAPIGMTMEPVLLELALSPLGEGESLRLVVPLVPSAEENNAEEIKAAICGHATLWNAKRHNGKYFSLRITAIDLAGNRAVAPGNAVIWKWNTEDGISICTMK